MDISLYLPQSRCAGLADLTIDAADATVGDLVAALVGAGWLPAEALGQDVCIDGVLAPLDHGLEEVGCADGSTLAVGADTAQAAAPEVPAVRIGVAGGLDAGRWLNVGAGRHRIGRGADALIGDVTASERHATLDVEASGRVTVVDHGSRNGTWINGQPVDRAEAVPSGALLRAGAIALRVEDQAVGDAPRGNDRAFNRPPRPAWPGLPAPLRAPADDPSADGKRPTLPMASAVGGLAMGTMMFVMTGTLLYAAVAFMMPIMTVGAAMAARRRHGRDARKAKVSARREMADFVAGVARASSQVSARQRLVHPDVAEVIRRAQAPSIRLWERRPEHGDAGHLVLGHATRAWEPAMERDGRPSEAATHAVTEHAWLREVPVVAPGGVIGIVGDRDAALSVARSLVAQACVHQGPADLEAILVTPDVLSWDGAKWLPHLRDQVNGRPRACAPGAGRALLSQVLAKRKPAADAERPGGAQGADAATLLVILDGVETCEGRDAPGRAVLRGLAGNVLGIVVATSVDKLPASCDTVVVLEGRNGACRVTHPERGEVVKGVLASGISSVTLADTARALARFDDPEAVTGGDLPHLVALPDLFDTATNTPARVQQRWQQQRLDGRLRVPIGMTADGPLIIDLSADGPHALVAGTTGAGKSELLRSLVAGLAVSADPDHVAFVLIDYKGGAAFDRCSDLPHVAGLVTDLDDDLAERALVCLHAELHRRERLLRAQAVADLDAYRRLPVSREEPLPSLVVVIDEFATLATELPDFLDSLVGIAQRGRSLGVHLILATQRPSGVVSDDIRANTNLRIALRVQDRQDSTDVIEEPAAATLTRDQPGRAYVRLGPSSVVQMQSALVTGPARSDDEAVRIRPFGLDQPARSAERPASADDEDPVTDLQVLVDAVRGAFEAEGLRAPREPWPAPLPERLPLQDLATMFDEVRRGSASIIDLTTDATIVLGVADDPEHQRRQLAGWDVDAGSLLVAGMAGSGTTSTLLAAVLGAAEKWTCEELHVYGLDAGRGQLAPLVGLPQTAGVVRLGEDERVARLVDTLAREVEARRRSGDVADAPRIIVAIDDWEAFTCAHETGPGLDLVDELTRVIVEGPTVGVVTVMTVGRTAAVTARLLSSIAQRWVMRLADDADASMLGVPCVAALPSGRIVDAGSGARVQIAWTDDVTDRVALLAASPESTGRAPRRGGPVAITRLPVTVDVTELPGWTTAGELTVIPVGQRGDDLMLAALRLHPGEHALIAGSPRSGRTTVLASLAQVGLAGGAQVYACAPRRGGLADMLGGHDLPGHAIHVVEPSQLTALLAALSQASEAALVLIDDAEQIEAPGLDAALTATPAGVHVIAAGRADAVRSQYGHWTRAVARSRTGLLLSPDVDLDGDLFGVRVPRHAVAPPAPGRGWLVDGGALAQCQPACSQASSPEFARQQAGRLSLAGGH